MAQARERKLPGRQPCLRASASRKPPLLTVASRALRFPADHQAWRPSETDVAGSAPSAPASSGTFLGEWVGEEFPASKSHLKMLECVPSFSLVLGPPRRNVGGQGGAQRGMGEGTLATTVRRRQTSSKCFRVWPWSRDLPPRETESLSSWGWDSWAGRMPCVQDSLRDTGEETV